MHRQPSAGTVSRPRVASISWLWHLLFTMSVMRRLSAGGTLERRLMFGRTLYSLGEVKKSLRAFNYFSDLHAYGEKTLQRAKRKRFLEDWHVVEDHLCDFDQANSVTLFCMTNPPFPCGWGEELVKFGI